MTANTKHRLKFEKLISNLRELPNPKQSLSLTDTVHHICVVTTCGNRTSDVHFQSLKWKHKIIIIIMNLFRLLFISTDRP